MESFRKKLALDEQSFAADPANAQARLDLAYCCLRMGELLAQSGDHAGAVPFYKRAVEMYKQDRAADPQDVTIGIRASIAVAHLGEELAKSGQVSRRTK